MWNGNQTNKTKSTEGTIFLHEKKEDNNFSSAYRFRSSNLKTDNKAKKPSPKKTHKTSTQTTQKTRIYSSIRKKSGRRGKLKERNALKGKHNQIIRKKRFSANFSTRIYLRKRKKKSNQEKIEEKKNLNRTKQNSKWANWNRQMLE